MMRELCRWCFGTGKVDADRFFKTDLLGQKMRGPVTCGQCHGKGHVDWSTLEFEAWSKERNQRILRKAVDLGGSAFSRESKQFGVQEIRWNHITHVYFRPKAICNLLGLIFPGDLESIEESVKHARFGLETDWVVTPATEDPRHLQRCKAIRGQLIEQFDLIRWPEFDAPMHRDNRFYSPLTRFKDDIFDIRRGRDVKSGWQAAVEAVKSASTSIKAA